MKRLILVLAALIAASPLSRADEGMWLPALISQRVADMQAKGLRLEAEDIYSVNHASLKDAVVLFGGGCTGEVVSDQGLLFTNHHCGYSYIQKHSSVEHDYLKDGFWAMTRAEELPNPGLTVRFLERMEDVTAAVMQGTAKAKTEAKREALMEQNIRRLKADAVKEGKGLVAQVEPLYYGNQYFLYVFREYRDVRLVGAPPSSIGKFGGETDNWMWPRHTGDFSIFRIYADADGNPADYSPSNLPYRPKKSFVISKAGVKEGDFTFVYGCPGSTREYIHSAGVAYISEVSDPEKIDLRTQRLDIMKKYMSQSQAVRIQYSSKYASVANAWKKWQGESMGIAKMGTVGKKEAYEARFAQWARGSRYEGITDRLAELYRQRNPLMRAYETFNESIYAIEILSFASRLQSRLGAHQSLADAFFKDYYLPIDKEVFVAMVESFDRNLPADVKPDWFKQKMASYGSAEAWKEDLFQHTILTDPSLVKGLTLEDAQRVDHDPAVEMAGAMTSWVRESVLPELKRLEAEIEKCYHDFMQGQMAFEPEKEFYPDANLTLRIAYGHVEGYSPCDAVYYKPVSTLKGIIGKDNPDIFDYNIPQRLRDIYAEGGHDDQPVCFLATNHTTGGNSGSPVLNADGYLVGINFDRVWEGTMSDIVFDPEFCRNISLDIRYLLFNIEYIGHAAYLFDEMTFAQ